MQLVAQTGNKLHVWTGLKPVGLGYT